MIRSGNVSITRGGRRLLDEVSVALEPGRFNVIIGPNGAGKSTLMRVLCGELVPDSGNVTYNDIDIALYKPVELARIRAVLPQSMSLAFPFTALEVVRMGAVARGSRHPADDARRALARAGMQGFENRSCPLLSGGEQQRVQFARALAQVPYPAEEGTPRALFLDEPTSSLDIGHQISVLEVARDFARGGGLVVAVLHDLNLAAEFADHVIVMHHGQVIAEGASLDTISDGTIAGVYGIGGAVGRLPADHIPYVLPQSRHR